MRFMQTHRPPMRRIWRIRTDLGPIGRERNVCYRSLTGDVRITFGELLTGCWELERQHIGHDAHLTRELERILSTAVVD